MEDTSTYAEGFSPEPEGFVGGVLDRIKREPVYTFAVVQALIGAVVVFGLALTAPQILAIETLTLAVLSWYVRRKVTPTA